MSKDRRHIRIVVALKAQIAIENWTIAVAELQAFIGERFHGAVEIQHIQVEVRPKRGTP